MNWASGLSFPCVRPCSKAAVGLGQELAMKLSLNSLANWSKDEMEDDFIRLYHIRAGPRSVVGKVRQISASEGVLLGSVLTRVLPAATSAEEHPDVGASALGPVEGCRGQWLGSSQSAFGRSDLLGETEKRLDSHDGRPEAQHGGRESEIQGRKPRVIEQPLVTIRCG
ncbi:hypothetical protein B296_00056928 [Ensete ventricosum]|uniref:Uncharacterized protein n=1 Tax=Ensete ventricosum TaxID=4639 RepID=A0A426XT91_ENSVE|nr:hypothetical protein B296_00056928 [Ensete ventricosum]